MSIILNNLPQDLEAELLLRARATGDSIEETVLKALRVAIAPDAGRQPAIRKKRDLSYLQGRFVQDPGFEEALASQSVIEPDGSK